MRVVIGIPPLEDSRGNWQVQQNRQAQVFVHGGFIFPCVPASAATMLKKEGHDVLWADGEAEQTSWPEYMRKLRDFNPDFVAFEVKTPSVKKTWERVRSLKCVLPDTTFILFGDHVTALPEETINAGGADVVITGGDYDFALSKILGRGAFEGIWNQPTDSKLETAPIIDRELCKWWLYGYEKGSGNYKYLPGTHTYWGRDCWWRKDGGCTFCSWTNTYKNFRVTPVDKAIEEVIYLHKLGIREIFDDTGTFPIGKWMQDFCEKIIKLREEGALGKKFPVLGANLRPGSLDGEEYALLGRAGFRFVLYGLESANQDTLDKINKGQRPGDMESTLRMAKRSGLEPHVTCMVGYPWETVEDAGRTISLTRGLFRKGLINTLQATIVIPYPGTELYRQAVKNDWLNYEPGDWDSWDMRRTVLKCPIKDEDLRKMAQGLYKSCITPKFVARQVMSIRDADDLKFIWRATKYAAGHLFDFKTKQA